ncbi:MAG: phosphoenolpyruvate synthase, partial [Bacteroidales bacterium]|nr:phosphoenolpyruvate synthase [Candidatus Sodaliphilus fimicaballi]
TTELALRDTQRYLCALDTTRSNENFSLDEGFNIPNLSVQDEARAGHLPFIVSTYDAANDYISDSCGPRGRHLVTFANVLKHGVFPLAKAAQFMLKLGQEQMGRPVEIEFAGNIAASPRDDNRGEIYWLQIRPMVDRREMLDDEIGNISNDKMLIRSNKALGHGVTDGITSIVMVKPEKFSFENNLEIASEIAKINSNFTTSGENYILIGPGRWGSSDKALGIPVRWTDIAQARLIVEQSVPGKRIDPSQGSHFFQNLTSFGVGYFTVGEADDNSVLDMEFLNSCTAVYDSEYVRIVKFDTPLNVAINGLKGVGVVQKPDNV